MTALENKTRERNWMDLEDSVEMQKLVWQLGVSSQYTASREAGISKPPSLIKKLPRPSSGWKLLPKGCV